MARLRNRYLVFIHDVVMIILAWLGAYWFRFNFSTIPTPYLEEALTWLPLVVVLQGSVFVYVGLYRGDWRFASLPDLIRIIKAAVFGTAICLGLLFLLTRLEGIPRSIFPTYAVLLMLWLGGPRFFYRWSRDRRLYLGQAKRVLIIGAGRAGEMLVRDLLRDTSHELFPIGFVDDQRNKIGLEIQGIRVLGGSDCIPALVEQEAVDLVLIAMPSASSRQMRCVVEYCEQADVSFRTLPRVGDLVAGHITIDTLREVSIEDLLGRDPVMLDRENIQQYITEKCVLISGGGGSIGTGLAMQIARMKPERLIIVEQSEDNLYQVERTLKSRFPRLNLRCSLGDIGDAAAVDKLLQEFKPSVIFHAAAYKHVPMLEGQIREAVQNNILGTRVLAAAADRYGCECMVLISTDKAVNPANVMGATKRAAEIFCQNLDRRSSTRYITVRFGNVLGSAGSVVPLFQELIKDGGPVTVTHPEITRYFMTIPEACQLILQSGTMGGGGEIFVLNMGEPIKIAYLAEQMIRLSGKVPGEDIEITYTGLRPGEKLYEELFHETEALQSTMHKKILLARHREVDWIELNGILDHMQVACANYDEPELERLLKVLVPEWQQTPAVVQATKSVVIAHQDSGDRDGDSPVLH